MTDALRSFWFEFDLALDAPCPPGSREGVGVTARDRADALALVAAKVFRGGALPPIRAEQTDIDFATLCPWSVLSTMTPPWGRGVWFPAGYGGD